MEILVTGKNLEITSRVREYVDKKLLGLQRRFKSIPALVLQVVLAEEKTKAAEKRFVAEFTTNVRGTVLRSEERGPDFYVAVDRAVETLDRQIERFKGKRAARRRNRPAPVETAPQSTTTAETDEAAPPSRIGRVKRHVIKPMSVDEAIDQMELLAHDFFLFFNRDSDELNVVYRRRAGDYGLIEVPAQ